ncbi:MAG: helix-turn-helix domain-containing protein [Blastocatellia bacterium]
MGRAARLRPSRLPEKLLYIRDTLGLSQNEIIREMGLDEVLYRNNISGFETGERVPQLLVLLRYARVAGICVDLLIDDELDLPKKLPGTPKHVG